MNPSVAQWLGALEWVMTQPGLLHGLPGGTDPIFRTDDPRLLAMLAGARRDPTRLLELLSAPRSHKVGIAFEALVHFGIEQGLGHTVLGRDVQIRAERRTVGALDVVLRTQTGVEEHWELAYKLFLQCKPDLGWSSWLGPGERDRLDTKVNRMRHHQIPLSARDVASEALAGLGVNEPPAQRAVLQGVLFSRWDQPVTRATDARIDSAGRWVRQTEMARVLDAAPDSRWVRRHKPLWFGPWVGPAEAVVSADAVRSQLVDAPLRRAQLWSVWNGPSIADEQLWFVVPERWGSRAR